MPTRGIRRSKKGEAVKRITKAMAGCPMLVAGTGRLDTELMEAGGGEIVGKLGSEAVLLPGPP